MKKIEWLLEWVGFFLLMAMALFLVIIGYYPIWGEIWRIK